MNLSPHYTTPDPIRACFTCAHMIINNDADCMCHAFAVAGARDAQGPGVPIRAARSASGACGPEARHIVIIDRQGRQHPATSR